MPWRLPPPEGTGRTSFSIPRRSHDHHTAYSQAVATGQLEDFAEMAGIECVVIDADTTLRAHKESLRVNDLYYSLRRSGA